MPHRIVEEARLDWLGTRGWLYIIVSGLDIDPLLIDPVAILVIDIENLLLMLHRRLPRLELHLHKAKASAPLGDLVPHNNSIDHRSEILEVFDEVVLCEILAQKLYLPWV